MKNCSKMQDLIVTIEVNIGAGKITLLQKFGQSMSGEDKVTMKVEHEPVKDFQNFYGNNCTRCLSTKNGDTSNCSTSL